MVLRMAQTNLAPLSHTCDKGTCKFPCDSDAPVVFLRQNPRPGPRIVYPYSNLRTRVARWTFLLVLVCLGHMYMESQGWANFATF